MAGPRREYRITVKALRREKPDFKRLSKALLTQAIKDAEEQFRRDGKL